MLNVLRDENGKVSSSRICLFTMLGLFGYLAVSGSQVEPVVWNTIQSVMLLCLGGASVRGTVDHLRGHNG